jgi:WD40 repeat protein
MHRLDVGKEERFRSGAFSPNGEVVAISCDNNDGNGEIRLYSAQSGKQIATLPCQGRAINRLAFGSGGDVLVAGGDGGACDVWSLASRKLTGTVKGWGETVFDVAFRPRHEHVATCWGGADVVISALTGQTVARFRTHRRATCISFASEGNILAVGDEEVIRVWDVGLNKEIAAVKAHEKQVNHLSFCPKGTKLVSVGGDGFVRVWDTKNWRVLAAWNQGEEIPTRVAIPVQSDVAAIGTWDGEVVFYNISDQATRLDNKQDVIHSRTAYRAHKLAVTALAYRSDGRSLLSGSLDGTARLWLGLPFSSE